MFFSSIKQIYKVIKVKECQTFTIKKHWRSLNFDFLGKKIWKNALALKSKNVQGIFGETFILALSSLAVFWLKNRVSDFFQFVCSGD